MRTKKWGIALALLLSAAMLMPNTAFAQSGDEGQSFVEDLVEHPQTETEEKEVVAEKSLKRRQRQKIRKRPYSRSKTRKKRSFLKRAWPENR